MLYWIWLTQINGVGPKRQRVLLKKFSTPERIYSASLDEILECDGIGDKIAETIIKAKSLESSKSILDNVEKLNIKLLNLHDSLYPSKAKDILEMPILLYYRGNLINNSMGVGIVGARRCTEYGKKVVDDAANYLAKENIAVISGMAKGIDGYAHTSCIKSGGYTIAMMGNGVDVCYPPEHIELMEEIIQNGAIISEYPPGTKPNPRYFPRRNLLISAWSHKVLVVEAGEKSGSLITANYARKYSREILALPDNIYTQESRGCNKLIYNGGRIYLDKSQLLIEDEYRYKNKSDNNSSDALVFSNLDKIEKQIMQIVSKGSKTSEEISILLGIENMELMGKLSLMELEGKINIKGSKISIGVPGTARILSKN